MRPVVTFINEFKPSSAVVDAFNAQFDAASTRGLHEIALRRLEKDAASCRESIAGADRLTPFLRRLQASHPFDVGTPGISTLR